jgi:4-carboxymuconolactone decarboxylase
MSRLAPASRDKVPGDQVALFDDLIKKYGLASHATASILNRVPRIWGIDRRLGNYLISESTLTQDVIELVFLVVGKELDCAFMWDLHAGPALKAGFSAELVGALRHGTELPKLSDRHLAVIHYGREIYRNRILSYGTFALVKEQFGERGLVDLGLLFGRLHMHALLLNGTDADLRPDRTEPVLPVY